MARMKKRRKPVSDINVVPYIDVMLVLLIIFMVTAPMMNLAVDIELPKSNAPPMDQKDEPIVVTVDREGKLFLSMTPTGERKPRTEKELLTDLTAFATPGSKRAVLISADASVSYGRVYEAMAIAQKANVERVGFVSLPGSSKTP